MKILVQGSVQGVISKEFEGKTTKKIQFLLEDEKNGIKVISVKLLENQNITEIKKGSTVSVECKCSTMKDSFDVFYSQIGELKVRK